MLNWIKKILLLIYLGVVFSPVTSFAFNPCNEIWYVVGTYTFPDHSETWNGTNYSRTENPLCPPWNKTSRSGCLKQFPLAGPWEIVYNKYCAEASDRTNFFTPQIKVRVQTCNLGCWTMSDHLDGDGECKIYPGAFGVPTMRLCARVALPADPVMGMNADHGYTYGWHLNHEGAPTQDPIYTGADGQPVYHARPKVCAYWDPSIYDALANYATFLYGGALGGATGMMGAAASVTSPTIVAAFKAAAGDTSSGDAGSNLVNMLQANLQPDLWDLNPVHQAIHYHEGGVFIIFQMIIQLIRMGVGMNNLMVQLVDSMPDGAKYAVMIIVHIYWIIRALAIIGEEVMIPVLEYLGQFNNVVAAALGCAMIPLGPYPPPYCDTLRTPAQEPKLNLICRTTTSGIESTNSTNQCVNSTLVNNAIRNSVRVGFREFIPLCLPADSPSHTCVRIHSTTNASTLHTMTANRDLLNVCNAARSNVPCVESPTLTTKCAADPTWCSQGIRVVYTMQAAGASPIMRDYYDTTLPSCTTSSGTCQGVWGVNVAHWRDISLMFPAIETGNNTANLVSSIQNLEDLEGNNFQFKLLIPRRANTIGSTELSPTRLYLMDNATTRILDSVQRAALPKPTVYECGSQGVTCTSHHLRPGIVAKIQVGSDSTKGALSTDTTISPRPLNTLGNHVLNLAGHEYTSFVTDASYNRSPFEGANAVNPSSVLGNYTNYTGSLRFSSTGAVGAHPATTPVQVPMYTGGLEYFQNKYTYGGDQICLSGYQFDDCFTSSSNANCVLTSLENASQVRCTDFINMAVVRYAGLGLCTSDQASSWTTRATLNIPRPSTGTLAVTIKGQTASGPYCYDYAGRATLGKLCDPSHAVARRVTPTPSFGAVLPTSQYYAYDRTSPPNPNTLAVRNKNAVEHGMCVDVPEARCAAGNAGNASWPQTTMGSRATGTCFAGSVPISASSLQRYCTFNRTTNTQEWEPVGTSIGCRHGCGVATNFPTSSYHAATKQIRLSTGAKTTGIYVYTLRVNMISPTQFTNFRIAEVGGDDSFKVEVNGVQVMGEPGSYRPGHEYAYYYRYTPNMDLKPHLRAGVNNIVFTLSVQGGGYGNLMIQYDHPSCTSVTISPI